MKIGIVLIRVELVQISQKSVLSKLPNFKMIFFKKIINKVYSQTLFRVDYLLVISDKVLSEVRNA